MVAGLWLGYRRGLVRQLSSLLGFVAGAVACYLVGTDVDGIVTTLLPGAASWPMASTTMRVVGLASVFLLVSLTVRVLGFFVRNLVHSLDLGALDRWGGSAFCTFKWLFVLSLLLNLWLVISPSSSVFTTRHAMNNKPFEHTLNLMPRVLGAKSMPADSLKTMNDNDSVKAQQLSD